MDESIELNRFLSDADATARLGAQLADPLAAALTAQSADVLTGQSDSALVINLSGPLGSGKTTLVRGLLRQLGVSGAIRSPTYTLVEPYRCAAGKLFHLDLYRLQDPCELEFLGLRDLLEPGAALLIEWAERGQTELPGPDLEISLAVEGDARRAFVRVASVRGAGLIRGVAGDV